ncbi:MAG TPA: cyclase family protein [Firmicutes bacterium]|nr:cyclase family protein [Bacillota bacterium]
MIVYDISMPIFRGMPVYKNEGKRQPDFERIRDYNEGAAETRLHIDSHTGTHLDAPSHMIPGGLAIHELPLDALVGECRILDLSYVEDRITADHLRTEDIAPGEFVLLKTRNSDVEGFDPGFVYLAPDAAEFLAGVPVRGVGIDALSVERNQPGHPTHITLFRGGVLVLEGLRLSGVAPGRYFLVAAPLKVIGMDGVPARVFLLESSLQVSYRTRQTAGY